MRGSLGKRLIQLSKDRQVIIFTHDLLFASQLVKNGSEQKIDFSTHVIDRPSFGIGRVNISTSPKMSNLDNLREKYTEAIKGYDNLDGSEIEFILEGPWDIEIEDSRKYKQVSLSFIDSHIGGSGYLPKIAEEFNKVAEDTIKFLDHENCVTACYRCLKSYQNQRHHEYFNWVRIIPDLEMIKEVQIKKRPKETGDIDDPKPWLEAYEAGVGSPLELKFLRLFEQFGLSVTKQEPVCNDDISKPISIADFAIREKRIAIYIDGVKFHVGQNLRRDRYIREKLRTGPNPWKVVELPASDLSKGKKLIEEILS